MNDENPIQPANKNLGEVMTATLDSFLSAAGAALQKNALVAFNRMLVSGADVATAHIQRYATVANANAAAEKAIIEATAKHVVKRMEVDGAYVSALTEKAAGGILRKQLNVDKAAKFALDELVKDQARAGAKPQPASDSEMNEDWLNAFERVAQDAGSEELQRHLGKILAGEIQRPGAFSIKTLRLVSQLDSNTVHAFIEACSLSIGTYVIRGLHDARVATVGAGGVVDGVYVGGLSHMQVEMLYEHGLLSSMAETYLVPTPCILDNGAASGYVCHQGEIYTFRPGPQNAGFNGFAFTRSGRELFPIVEQTRNEPYARALRQHLRNNGLEVVPSTVHPDHFARPT